MSARLRRLDEFDQLAKKAQAERKFRHEEWKGWKSRPAPVRILGGGKRNSMNEGTMVIVYDRAGQIKPLLKILMVPSDLPQRHGSETMC